jgi:YebC/PmpR family DNA-binding regulatory protein
MSGHSKWHNIQRRKGKQDAVRAQLFTKVSRDIYYAAKEGGGNPDTNFRLKTAIDRAKECNLPADNIARTIAKATGTLQGVTYEEIMYEGYGPNGVAMLIEIVTDNRNRTAADIRHIFKKRGGNLGESGSVAWMFKRMGTFTIEKNEQTPSYDDLFMVAIEAGASDLKEDEGEFVISTEPEAFREVRQNLESSGIEFEDAELGYEPTMTTEVSSEQADAILDLIEALESHDDVQNVYTTAKFPDED